MTIPNLIDVVRLLATGGGIGAILSFLLERVSWFQNLPSTARYWLVLGVSVGLPVLAAVALQFVPAEVWEALQPYWNALAAGFLVWLSSQVAHKWLNKK